MKMFFRNHRNVFIECERFDAEITARDNALINKEKEMFTNLFQKQGNGTLTCPRCGGVIGTGQYILIVKSVPYHNYCGEQERNKWGFPIELQKQ